ncbi:PAS domain-containing protein [Halovivax limisalsi]|uniref:PAS domain-containing protein n=1 Tax=Halovivax limisalsi TaxID=1453760 RepID=UPI001FFC6232|nr:PAS domain-containing protein [Halovivax limisalsi]
MTTAQPPVEDTESALLGVDCVVVGPSVEDAAETIRLLSADIPVAAVLDDGEGLSGSDALAAGAAAILRPADLQGDATIAANRLATAVAAESGPTGGRIDSERQTDGSSDTPFRRPYRTLVEAVGDPMYVVDASGHFRIANEALAQYTAYERAELPGVHASKIIGEANFDRASELINSVADADEKDWGRIELSFDPADGESRVWEATIAPFEADGDVIGSAGVVRDVSERVRRIRELARYETIVETAPTGLFVVGAEGTITWANDEFVGAFAEPAAEIIGAPFGELVERGYFGPDIVTDYLEYVGTLLSSESSDEIISSTVRFHGPDGDTRHFESYNALLPLEDGEFNGTVHAFRDVTEQRRYQRELERQNERLDQFASLISHDLRNPLNVAQGHADVLREAVDHESVSEIGWALDRMEALTADLLSLARQGQTVGDPEPVDLAAIVGEAWDVVDTDSATLDRHVEETVRADPRRVRELFTNLFRNAVEHAGADVTVRVGRLQDDTGTDDTQAGLYVEDDGPGLPDEDVFEVGYTTASDGTGFGLAIVAEIAEAHGWTVTAGESASGGARFEFRDVDTAKAEPPGRY